jgi:hypothetical protein
MMSKLNSTRVAGCAAGSWLLAALLLVAPATVAALGDGTDHDCGAAEPCAVMSPLPHSASSAGAKGKARDRESSVRAVDRRASRKVRASKKVAPSTPTLVATDASATASLSKGRIK